MSNEPRRSSCGRNVHLAARPATAAPRAGRALAGRAPGPLRPDPVLP